MRSPLALSAVAALALFSVGPVHAQGAPQTVQLAKVDVIKTATGYRASKIIGASVVNDANETVGKVDDIIVGTDKMPYLVLSVGGFLGVGSKDVAVKWSDITIGQEDNSVVLTTSLTKDALMALPDYTKTDRRKPAPPETATAPPARPAPPTQSR